MVRTAGIRLGSRGLFELVWSFSGRTTLMATSAVPPGVTPSFSRSVVTVARGRPCAAPIPAVENSATRHTDQRVSLDNFNGPIASGMPTNLMGGIRPIRADLARHLRGIYCVFGADNTNSR